jgi:Zn-finger nucleic acid-binding protein
MRCPVCRTARLNAPEQGEGPPSRECPDCGGRYIASAQYFAWLQKHGEDLPERPAGEGAHLPVRDSAPGKLCPECGAFLIRHRVGHGIGFHIDRCGRCGGIWFDRNEWDILRSRNLHDNIHHVFSEAWQTEVKSKERSDSYRRMVTGILDEKLLRRCSRGDLRRLKDLKGWIDAHSAREDLYAYLWSTRDL